MQKCCTWTCLSFGDKKLVSSRGWNGTCFLKPFLDLGPWTIEPDWKTKNGWSIECTTSISTQSVTPTSDNQDIDTDFDDSTTT